MDDFYTERELEDAGVDAFEFSLMDEDERRQVLEDAFLDPDLYMDADFSSSFNAWERLQFAGMNLRDLEYMDDDERREKLEEAGLDPLDYEGVPHYVPRSPARNSVKPVSNPAPLRSAQPKQEPSKQERIQPKAVYRYCMVEFSSGSQTCSYRTEDRSIAPGDQVIVPDGGSNKTKLGKVISVGDYTEETVPNPIESAKFILRKASAEDMPKEGAAASAPQSIELSRKESAPQPMQNSDASEPIDTTKRKKAWAAAAAAAVIILILGAVFRNWPAIVEMHTQWQEEQKQQIREDNIRSFLTSVEKYEADEVENILDMLGSKYRDRELYNLTSSVDIRIESEETDQGDRWFWKETVFIDVAAKEEFEDCYDGNKALCLRRYALHAFDEMNPSNHYSLPTAIDSSMQKYNIDRQVVCLVELTTLNNTYEYELDNGIRSSADSYYLNGELHVVVPTPTPRPTPTPQPTPTPRPAPRRTTSTPKPVQDDPFNARDYYFPEDFYYDYYDDFWDYEDAEDYWEEWND